jgi:hypothetical protein
MLVGHAGAASVRGVEATPYEEMPFLRFTYLL